jgi:integrase
MATSINRLTVAQIARLDKVGRHADGGGLYLAITKNGDKINRSWIFRFRGGARFEDGPNKGRRRLQEMGLGSLDTFSLAEARERAKKMRQLRADGRNPIEERRAQRRAEEAKEAQASAEAAKVVTFAQATRDYIADNRAGWGAVHAQQFENTLQTFAFPTIGKLAISEVGTPDIAALLRPIWVEKHTTAKRVRSRIESVWSWAKAHGYCSGDNPAAWAGALAAILPATKKLADVEVEHHEALPFAEVPTLMGRLRASEDRMARVAEALVLTVARTSELLGMRWEDIDLEGGRWRAGVQRSKTKIRHDTPLSPRLVEILREFGSRSSGLVFPAAPDRQKTIRIGTLREFLRRIAGRSDISLHGFRSSFADWRAVVHPTRFSADAAEAALGHVRGSVTRRSYERDDLFEPRVPLMTAWSEFCAGEAVPSADVTELRSRRKA